MNSSTITGTWNYPTAVRFGPGRIAELAEACEAAGITRALFVTDPGLAQLDITAGALEVLSRSGLVDESAPGANSCFFSDVHPNPIGEDVALGLERYRSAACDGVVAFGGGAAMDAGKTIALMAGQKRSLWEFEDVGDNFKLVDESAMSPCVCIPTTAGTGSEVGRASVILDPTARRKKIIFHPKMLPVCVIADPELTIALPPHITAATGIDAFVHCLEAFCAPGFHPMADGIAVEGMRLIARALPRAFNDGTDITARAEMLVAATMGATAFQKGLGAVHAISHPVGALFNTHHGLTNAVVLPYVLTFNRPAIEKKLAYLARALKLPTPTPDAFLSWILNLRADLNIPNTLADLGVNPEAADELGILAANDPAAPSNPRPVNAAHLTTITLKAITGD